MGRGQGHAHTPSAPAVFRCTTGTRWHTLAGHEGGLKGGGPEGRGAAGACARTGSPCRLPVHHWHHPVHQRCAAKRGPRTPRGRWCAKGEQNLLTSVQGWGAKARWAPRGSLGLNELGFH